MAVAGTAVHDPDVLEIRSLRDVDPADVVRQDERGFSFRYGAATPVALADLADMDGWVAVDGGEAVGFVGLRDFELTVPGPRPLAASGVTWVSVAASHRRQGVAAELMGLAHETTAAAGRPVAVLTASEAAIYRRFGYGVATTRYTVRIDRRGARFDAGLEDDVAGRGRCRYVRAGEVTELCRPAYERYRAARAGAVSRRDPWWKRVLIDPAPQWVVHEDASGVVDGFARYTVEQVWDHGHPAHRLVLDDLVSATATGQEALWRLLLGIDLVGPIDFELFDGADPLPWQLDDPRAVRIIDERHALWVCPLDAVAALAGRGYSGRGRVVLDVEGTVLAVDAGPDGADVSLFDGPAHLELGRSELGSLLLGGVRATTLVRARRATELVAGAAAAVDRLFVSDPPPHLATWF